jgi:class 3 adenylate cyclase
VFWAGDTYSVLAEIGEFVTGVRPPKEFQRFLATILFTDIVDSTKHLSDKGDRKWIDILAAHNRIVRKQLDIYNGKEIKITGDGFLATFDGPSKAIRCAGAIREELLQLGIEITAGIHTGECEVLDTDDIGGIAVHIASRVMDKASPGQILITMTVKYLLGGTGLEFTDIGEYNLRGIDEPYRLYALKSSGKRLY